MDRELRQSVRLDDVGIVGEQDILLREEEGVRDSIVLFVPVDSVRVLWHVSQVVLQHEDLAVHGWSVQDSLVDFGVVRLTKSCLIVPRPVVDFIRPKYGVSIISILVD